MARTLLIGTGSEVGLNNATTLSSATVVRVINLSGADVVFVAGGSDCLGVKVGFTA